jgi:hypothetical protein
MKTKDTSREAEMPRKRMIRLKMKMDKPRIDITHWGATQEDRYRTYQAIIRTAQSKADIVTATWCSKNPEQFPCGWARIVFKPKEPYNEFIQWAIARGYVYYDVGPKEHILMVEEKGRTRRKDLESALLWSEQFASILKANSIECTVRDRID